jgi:MFS family permease
MYHGWKIVICAFCVALFGWGLGFYGAAVLVAELTERLGWSTTLISLAVTAYYVLGAVLILPLARAFERYGPRPVVLVGMAAMAAGTIGVAYVDTPWQLYLAFALRAVGWACMSGAALNLLVAPWFERKRGMALSQAFNGASCGGVVIAPLLLFLIAALGFRGGVLATVLIMVATLGPLAAAWLYRGPEALGLRPDGDARPAAASDAVPGRGASSPRRFLAEWRFWSISVPFALALAAQVGFLTHQVALAKPILGAAGTAWCVSLTALAAVLGRSVTGLFVDKADRRMVAAGNFLLQAVALALLALTPTAVGLYVYSVVFGLGVGNVVSLPGLIAQVEFPKAAFTRVVSTLVAINQFTFAFGPGVVGWLYDRQGSYGAALAVCAALMLAASAGVLWRGAPR